MSAPRYRFVDVLTAPTPAERTYELLSCPRVNKKLVRRLTPLLRPLFRWNHRWAMRRGKEALRRLAAE